MRKNQVQVWAAGKGMIRLLFNGKVVGFAADWRAARVKQQILESQLGNQGAI